MEQLFLISLIRLIEQSPADSLDKAAGEQCPARPPRTCQDCRLDRPHAELAEMVERLAIGVGNDEAGVSFTLRPVERKRDLVRALLHRWAFEGCPLG
jgi:hypothetical protein